jgi:hypothetical protein
MTIQQGACTSYKVELAKALHNFSAVGGNTFKIALIRANALQTADFGATITNYSDLGANEVVAAGYTAGGETLTNIDPASSGTAAFWSFDNVSWTASITAAGALIYNVTSGDRAVAVLSFGGDKTGVAGVFTATMPTNSTTTSILRIA